MMEIRGRSNNIAIDKSKNIWVVREELKLGVVSGRRRVKDDIEKIVIPHSGFSEGDLTIRCV